MKISCFLNNGVLDLLKFSVHCVTSLVGRMIVHAESTLQWKITSVWVGSLMIIVSNSDTLGWVFAVILSVVIILTFTILAYGFGVYGSYFSVGLKSMMKYF